MNSIPMGPKELRNTVWPLMRQPMPLDEIAKGISVTFNISPDEAEAAVAQLDKDLRRLIIIQRHTTRETSEIEKEKVRMSIAPIAEIHFEAMWQWAGWVVAKGG